MRNKNVVIGLLVIFSFICLYNLFHTFNQFNLEKEVDALAIKNEEYQRIKRDSTDYAVTDAFRDEYQSFREKMEKTKEKLATARKNSFTLGLDLQGGMFVTMEIEVADLLRQMSSFSDPAFEQALAEATTKKVGSQDPYVDLFYESLVEIKGGEDKVKLAAYFVNKDQDIDFNTSNADVRDKLRSEADDAINRTFEIIRTRIDEFGVASPNLQLQEGSGRILIELPGVKDEERVRELLRGTAKLEFWETPSYEEAFNEIMKANEVLKLRNAAAEATTDADSEPDAGEGEVDPNAGDDDLAAALDEAVDGAVDVAAGEEGEDDEEAGGLTDILAGGGEVTPSDSDTTGIDTTLSIEEQRKQFLVDYPIFEHFSPLERVVDPNYPMIGYAAVEDTAEFMAQLRDSAVATAMSSRIKFFWEAKPVQEGSDVYGLVAIKMPADGIAKIEGDRVTNASQDFDNQSGKGAVVNLRMDAEGAQTWKTMTGNNVGKCVAISLDRKILTYPTVQQQISGGSTQISGNFEVEEAQDIASMLKAGKLPVAAKIIGEDRVGPTLGEENINSGLWSFFIAFIVTIVFMTFYYTSSGMVANIALVCNLLFILGVSAAVNVVLTLPGIAAVVLTMGMAVDANVLIFERIREERSLGKSLKAAITSGFSNAFSSVMDANITTFMTGVILYAFGVGPIRGFAVSLMIGIITSLISALFITRLILDFYGNRGKEGIKFGSKLTTNIFSNIKMKMIERRKLMYVVSGVLMTVSIVSIIAFGFKTGVDFKGGQQFKVSYSGAIDYNTLVSDLTDSFEGDKPVVKTIGGGGEDVSRLLVTTSWNLNNPNHEVVEAALTSGLIKSHPDIGAKIEQSTKVGPTVANDIKRSAVYSVLGSLIIIFLYILLRFRKWQYSLGALASLFHDVIIVLGFFSILGYLDFLPFSIEIDQAFIAAVLTIIGYSINDTVVVFDRIRENSGEMKTAALGEIFGISIDQTISRTLITSLTTFLTAMILFLLGGDAIQGFIFALLLGIFFGTYSSIFVASPIAHDLIAATGGLKRNKKVQK